MEKAATVCYSSNVSQAASDVVALDQGIIRSIAVWSLLQVTGTRPDSGQGEWILVESHSRPPVMLECTTSLFDAVLGFKAGNE